MDSYQRGVHQVGAKLAELRAGAGLSQAALGRRLDVTQAAVSAWERGERLPRPRELIKLGREFGVAPAEILEPLYGAVPANDMDPRQGVRELRERAEELEARLNELLGQGREDEPQ